MLPFTKQEITVLTVIAAVILAGTSLNIILKKYPQILHMVNFIERDDILPQFDVNQASEEELISIPYIGPYTAKLIIQYRQDHGAISDLETIRALPGIHAKNYEIFSKYLKIRGGK